MAKKDDKEDRGKTFLTESENTEKPVIENNTLHGSDPKPIEFGDNRPAAAMGRTTSEEKPAKFYRVTNPQGFFYDGTLYEAGKIVSYTGDPGDSLKEVDQKEAEDALQEQQEDRRRVIPTAAQVRADKRPEAEELKKKDLEDLGRRDPRERTE